MSRVGIFRLRHACRVKVGTITRSAQSAFGPGPVYWWTGVVVVGLYGVWGCLSCGERISTSASSR